MKPGITDGLPEKGYQRHESDDQAPVDSGIGNANTMKYFCPTKINMRFLQLARF
jgi:hypothetical protein